MAHPILVPRLGWSMEHGTFLGWLKRDGQAVRAGEPLFRLEGDKAEQEIEAVDAGVLHLAAWSPREGTKVDVGATLAYLLAPGEAPPPAPGAVSTAAATAPPTAAGPHEAARPAADPAHGKCTPRARRAAKERGVDWTSIAGTGRGGRVRERDVLAAAGGGGASPGERRVPHSAARRAIARRLTESLARTAQVTITATADVTALVAWRAMRKAASSGAPVPTITDWLVHACALALREHELLAARWEEDALVLPDSLHVGIAVDTDAGLLVPVIRDTDRLTLEEIAARARDLAARARSGRLRAGELEGSVFTVSNLGMFGAETFTPILNPPETAVLGAGRIRRQPAVVGERIVPRDLMPLSLTFDHRVVDGAPAARFLDAVRRRLAMAGTDPEAGETSHA